jgi:S1-C subfamily serine protease
MIDLVGLLAPALFVSVQRLQRSLVVVQDGSNSAGAGIVWRRGFILTNHHVVAHKRALKVSLADGGELPVRLVDSDPEIDLALLQVDDERTPPAMIADSRILRVGQYVMAIGHPWGERGLVTGGIISGLGTLRINQRNGSVEIIRTDARLGPGNSGGPLVNASGAVIGINTMILGGDLGVAIPTHVVSIFIQRVLEAKKELRPGKGRGYSYSQAGQPEWGRML